MLSWIGSTLLAAACGGILGFWGWLAVKVIEQGRKLVELESRIISNQENFDDRLTSQENHCKDRLAWLRAMDEKLDAVSENTAKICGKLGI